MVAGSPGSNLTCTMCRVAEGVVLVLHLYLPILASNRFSGCQREDFQALHYLRLIRSPVNTDPFYVAKTQNPERIACPYLSTRYMLPLEVHGDMEYTQQGIYVLLAYYSQMSDGYC
ncbi:hypothetical protein FOXB_07344 [Fusarium oxysporum f. sp. conglutinans Fo5176]|uniref:Uncharacterized protein n=1 Tax=Fusarium oxysporum (strain Fo5176) TaxID=660025 RepID=F9FLR4_FUSOF|nr:hypothetical protein FOXB_07344 [Fusarium oxysporum f. sp. conglutinans Fo5176]